jgi:hypothetical protein
MHRFGLLVVFVCLLVGLFLGVGALLFLLVTLAALLFILGLGLWIGKHYSVSARAERAARAGRIGEALLLSTKGGLDDSITPLVLAAWPTHPDTQFVVESAFRELAALHRLSDRARSLGVARVVLDSVGREAEIAANVLRNLADRLSIVGGSARESEGIIDAEVERTLARIDHLSAALRAARTGLVELTLRETEPGDLAEESSCIRLLALAETVHELASLADLRAPR